MSKIDAAFGLIIVAVVLLVVGAVAAANDEAKTWKKFKQDHDCKIVAHIRGDTFNTFHSDGTIGVGRTPDKTGWACDDGITYFRG